MVKVVLIGSPKGGVGKSFVAANLAVALARMADRHPGLGRVALMDCDPQNATRLHFGIPGEDGWAGRVLAGSAPLMALADVAGDVSLLPFGHLDGCWQTDVEQSLATRPEILDGIVAGLAERGVGTLVCDLKPGVSTALTALAPRADANIHVLMADPASMSLLPDIEAGRYPGGGTLQTLAARDARFVLNQVDWTFPLSERIARAIAQKLRDRLLGAICRDTAVMEALAYGRPLSLHAPTSDAARDLATLADTVARQLATRAPNNNAGDDDLPPMLKGLL